jgi:hypothetical protein
MDQFRVDDAPGAKNTDETGHADGAQGNVDVNLGELRAEGRAGVGQRCVKARDVVSSCKLFRRDRDRIAS